MIDRRTAVHRTLAGAGILALRPSFALAVRADAPMHHQWKPVQGRPHVFIAAGVSGNMTLILGKSGERAVLIDGQTAPFGKQIRREAEQLGKKVGLLVNTHAHPEITGSNHAFTVDTRVLASEGCKTRISGQVNRYISQIKEFLFRPEDDPTDKAKAAIRADWRELHDRARTLAPADFAPTETIDARAARHEVEIDGRRLVLLLPRRTRGGVGAHTDHDVVVHLPDDDVLIVGGLASAGMHVAIDRDAGAHSVGWQEALKELELAAGPDAIVVPAEGPVGKRDLLVAQREYLRDLRKAVEQATAAGKSRAEVRALTPDLRLPADAPGRSRLPTSLDAVFDEIRSDKTTE